MPSVKMVFIMLQRRSMPRQVAQILHNSVFQCEATQVLPGADHLCRGVSWFHTRRYARQVAQVLPGHLCHLQTHKWHKCYLATWAWLRPCRSPSVGSSADTSVRRIPTEGLLLCVNSCRSLSTSALDKPIQPNLVNMSSGATSSESESSRMVIQAPFIIAPTHQTTIAASKIKESASVGSQEEEDGPQPLVMSGPSGAGTF